MKKFLKISFIVVVIMLLFPRPVYAYLDPSVVTYAIQVVVGMVIAVGAVIYIYWRQAKQKLSKKLGISDEPKKELEADIEFYQSTETEQEEIK
ncbi:hypothetical protein [Candidatus Brevifilum fermentans]|jgi:hypothetical protein|uniref:Uncharacterized protein n=1 Tax=Candidatus Brevifilum fermentans TaxID=1986204 RepID=A0A1Y6K888_9CHLR|nr:hypothetical protein [Brevefilum fermentans]MDI9567029.1 hypothetical protein [Chloroflexota bacterium]SMX54230.1 conserved exported protein of unknown function [Brevefilum fermentans]